MDREIHICGATRHRCDRRAVEKGRSGRGGGGQAEVNFLPWRDAAPARRATFTAENTRSCPYVQNAPAARRIVPLRARRNPRDEAAAGNQRLPLPRLPEDVGQRLFADRDHPRRRLRGDEGRAGDRRPAWRRHPPLLLRALHDVDVHARPRHGLVRKRAPDHAGRRLVVPPLHGDIHLHQAALRADGRCAQLRQISGHGGI